MQQRSKVAAGWKSTRGNALVEFALGFGLISSVLTGAWQFGYSFYAYNALQTAVRNGARYGSLADYDGGLSNGTAFKSRVRNQVVYGKPNPATTDAPLLPGLTTALVGVTVTTDSSGVPSRVTVQVEGFQLPGGFVAGIRLDGKPACTFDYAGRYTVP